MDSRLERALHFVVLSVLALGAAGCRNDASAPASAPVIPDGRFHSVRFATTSGQPGQFTARRNAAHTAGAAAATSASATGDFTFWAYTDRDATISVDRLLGDGTSEPYVTVSVPRGALYRRPDGSAFGLRDSIEITVTPDDQDLRVTLEPSGLVFNPLISAQLTISYQGANADFNGDGVVNELDAYIEQVLLGLYTQQQPTDPWQVIPSINDVINKTLSAFLHHFTGYAVSW